MRLIHLLQQGEIVAAFPSYGLLLIDHNTGLLLCMLYQPAF
jgi:hypothetical protein